eukprot:scpid73974/ scgid35742/ 
MDDRTKRVLIANRDKLRTGISAASLLPVLYSRFVIDDEVKHDIQHTEMNTKRTSMQQADKLLDHIQGGGQEAFFELVEAMEDPMQILSHQELAQLLRQELKNTPAASARPARPTGGAAAPQRASVGGGGATAVDPVDADADVIASAEQEHGQSFSEGGERVSGDGCTMDPEEECGSG